MKKTIFTLTIIAFIAGTISTSSGQVPDNKSFKAKENLKEAPKNIMLENQNFKKNADAKIQCNEKCFAEFKAKLKNSYHKDKASFQKMVLKLEQKNTELKTKLANYKKEKRQDKLESFNKQFNHDMEELEMQMWSIR